METSEASTHAARQEKDRGESPVKKKQQKKNNSEERRESPSASCEPYLISSTFSATSMHIDERKRSHHESRCVACKKERKKNHDLLFYGDKEKKREREKEKLETGDQVRARGLQSAMEKKEGTKKKKLEVRNTEASAEDSRKPPERETERERDHPVQLMRRQVCPFFFSS